MALKRKKHMSANSMMII